MFLNIYTLRTWNLYNHSCFFESRTWLLMFLVWHCLQEESSLRCSSICAVKLCDTLLSHADLPSQVPDPEVQLSIISPEAVSLLVPGNQCTHIFVSTASGSFLMCKLVAMTGDPPWSPSNKKESDHRCTLAVDSKSDTKNLTRSWKIAFWVLQAFPTGFHI